MSNIVFACVNCGLCQKRSAADAGCSNCDTRLFRVVYANNPYGTGQPYRGTPKNPYRHDQEEDGYQFTTPFGAESAIGPGDMSNTALGTGENSGNVGLYHEPGDPFDRNMTGGDSDNFFPADSPMRRVNQNEPHHVGPHNMPHFNLKPKTLYERVLNRKRMHR